MSTTSVTIGANESTRRATDTMAEDFGFDTSPITHAFRKQVEREQVIPPGPECPEPNNESLESIREAERIVAEKRPGYTTAEEMFDAMGAHQLDARGIPVRPMAGSADVDLQAGTTIASRGLQDAVKDALARAGMVIKA